MSAVALPRAPTGGSEGTKPNARAAPFGLAVPIGRAEGWLLALILAGSLALRLWRLDLAPMGYDEGDVASLVAAWTLHGLFPLTGTVTISVGGLVFPPAWPYVLAPALLVALHPYGELAMGLLWGMLAVVLSWWVGRRWLGSWGGLAAATFMGAGIYPVLVGRTAWQPAFLPVLTLLCFDALLMLAVRRRPWALVLATTWLVLMAQFHWIAAMYVVVFPLAISPARKTLRPVHLASAVMAVLVGTFPFLLYELHPDVRFEVVRQLLGAQTGQARVDLTIFDYYRLLSSNGGAIGLGTPNEAGLAPQFGKWSALGQIGPLLVLAGVLLAVATRTPRWPGWLIAIWLVLPQVLLARHTLDLVYHYMDMNLPVLGLAMGLVASSGYRLIRLGAGAALALFAVVSAASYVLVVNYAGVADVHQGYGVPIRDSLQAGQVTRGLVPPGASVMVAGYRYEAEILRFTVGYDTPSQRFDDCTGVPYEPGAVYLLLSETTPGGQLLADAGAPLLARVPRPGDAYLVYGSPTRPPDNAALQQMPQYQSRECKDRRDWLNPAAQAADR